MWLEGWKSVDVVKRAGRVGFGSSQSGLRVKQVTGQNRSFLNRSIRMQVGSGLPVFFKKKIFFFNYKNKSMTTCLERMNKIN